MKEGWTYKKLGEVATFLSGYTPKKSDLYPNGEIPYFKVAEMNLPGNEKELRNTSFYLRTVQKIFPKGAIVFPKNGGAIYTEKKRILAQNSVIDLNSEALVANVDFVSPMFLFCLLSNIKISQFDKGGGLPSLDIKRMQDHLIPVPPLSEQQQIVDRLDSAFAKIDAVKANAEKQLSDAKNLFQKALSKAMEPKEGWEEKKLGEVCEITSVLVNPVEEKYKELLHVGGANIMSENGKLIGLKTAEEEGLISGKFLFEEKDVLYNKIRPYLKKIARPDFSGLCSADMYPLRHKKNITRDYLFYVLITKDFTEYAILNSGRAGMPKINRQAIFAYSFYLPPLSEQQRMVTHLDTLSEKLKATEERQIKIIAECDAMKQALLREVFE